MKIAKLVLLICTAILTIPNVIAWNGSGNSDDPYQISTEEDLIELASNVNARSNSSTYTGSFFILTDDIFLTKDFTPIGSTSKKCFSGTFDGNGKTIYNLTITASKGPVGLFGYVKNGTIKNLTISGADVSVTENKSAGYGIIVGYLQNVSTLSNCGIVNSSITCSGSCVGGIVGYTNGTSSNIGTVSDCFVINSFIKGKDEVGGICGKSNDEPYYTMTGNIVDANTVIQGQEGNKNIRRIYGHNDYYEKEEYNNTDLSDNPSALTSLVVGKWNLVGIFTDEEESNVSILNTNGESPSDYSASHDMAALNYDYNTNAWGTNYLSVAHNDKFKRGESLFAWPFEADRNLNELNKKTGSIIYWKQGNNRNTETVYKINLTNNGVKRKDDDEDGTNGALWFALSNPFAVATEPSVLVKNLNNIQGEQQIYTWDGNRWNANPSVIYPGQGFMVAASGDNKTINGELRLSASKSKTENSWITFTCRSDNSLFNIFAKINDKASDNFDAYDSYALFSGNNDNFVEPYFEVEGRYLIKNEFKSLPYTCNLNFKAEKDNQIYFSASDIPDDITVILSDIKDNTQTVLNDTTLQINVAKGNNEMRFYLNFVKKQSDITALSNQSNEIKIWNDGKTVKATGNNLRYIEIYDICGQKIIAENINCDLYSHTLNVPDGVYLIKVKTENYGHCGKLIIK